MWLRRFLVVLFVFALCLPTKAQQPTKVPRIGFLTTGFPASIAHLLEGFKQGLREHGYVDGQNVLFRTSIR